MSSLEKSSLLTQLPHNHQKGKQCRACRTLRKIAKDEKEKQIYSTATREFGEVLKESILAGGYAIGQGLSAIGQWGRGLAGNPDPVAQGAALAIGIIGLEWFVASYPDLAKKLHLDGLLFQGGGGGLPPEQANGQFCVLITSLAGVKSHKCYATTVERDQAHNTLTSQSLGLYTVTDYTQTGGTAQYCVRAIGLLGATINSCFSTAQERDQFIAVGLSTKRIANPEPYDTVVPGSSPPVNPNPGHLGH